MRTLSRTAVYAGVTLITVLTLATTALAAASYTQVVDLTFPVAGESSYIDDFDQCRSSCARRHRATDIMARYGQKVHAAVGGRVTWITGLDGDPPDYGFMITIAGDDGRSYSYVHLGRNDGPPGEAYVAGIKKGSVVSRGQHIGFVGCSGNASCSAPHLHFSIEDPHVVDVYGSNYINPYNSLSAAEERGDVPGALAGLPLAGDWDGDGDADTGWYRDGQVTLHVPDSGEIRFTYGRRGDLPIVGDWDADGVDSLGIVRQGGEWHLVDDHRGGTADVTFTYGRVGSRGSDLPLVGDWSGDGMDTVGIVRDGEWHLRNTLSGGPGQIVFTYGRVGPRGDDIPLIGDWDGDGKDTVGIVRDGEWHLRFRLAGGPADRSFVFGRTTRGDVPVIGDWIGDGTDTAGIVRGHEWHLRYVNSAGAADLVLAPPS